jgi:hypothetical protein
VVINLINSASCMKGEVSVIGGQSILLSVVISKIKASGPSAFSPGEQSYTSPLITSVLALVKVMARSVAVHIPHNFLYHSISGVKILI